MYNNCLRVCTSFDLFPVNVKESCRLNSSKSFFFSKLWVKIQLRDEKICLHKRKNPTLFMQVLCSVLTSFSHRWKACNKRIPREDKTGSVCVKFSCFSYRNVSELNRNLTLKAMTRSAHCNWPHRSFQAQTSPCLWMTKTELGVFNTFQEITFLPFIIWQRSRSSPQPQLTRLHLLQTHSTSKMMCLKRR